MGYVLMLIIMTYNVWLVVSVCCGAGVGYLIAGVIRVTTTKQNMKKRAKVMYPTLAYPDQLNLFSLIIFVAFYIGFYLQKHS